jgi:hypothetical protein
MLTEIAIKSFFVLAIAAVTATLLRRSAATRHLIWTLAVVVVFAMPALIALAPRQAVTVDGDSALAHLATRARPAAAPVSGRIESPVGAASEQEAVREPARRDGGTDPAPPVPKGAVISNGTTAGRDAIAPRDVTLHRIGTPGSERSSDRAAGDEVVSGSDVAPDRDAATDTPGRLRAGALALPVAALAFTTAPGPAGAGAPAPGSVSAGSRAATESARGPVLGGSHVGTEPSPSAAAPQVSECWAPNVERNSRNMSNSDDDQRTLEWESDNCSAELRLRGELSFNDDFSAVTGISAGGSFALVHREGGVERRLDILPGVAGAPHMTWRIDGRERPFDAEAQQWFSGVLLQILRASGIAAEARTAAIYRAQGVEGVLREVELMPRNSARGLYLVALVEQAEVDDGELTRLLDAAGDIDSNGTRGRVLAAVGRRYPERILGGAFDDAYWRAVAGIDSNSTINSLLLDISNGAPVDSGLLPLIFDTAQARISSNSTLADFILAIERRYPDVAVSGPLTDEFWATVERVDSSSTLSSLLLELAAGKSEDSAMLDRVLDAANRIDSSSQRGRFLLSFALQHQDAARGRLRDRILQMANGIDSRSSRERTLRDLGQLGIG